MPFLGLMSQSLLCCFLSITEPLQEDLTLPESVNDDMPRGRMLINLEEGIPKGRTEIMR